MKNVMDNCSMRLYMRNIVTPLVVVHVKGEHMMQNESRDKYEKSYVNNALANIYTIGLCMLQFFVSTVSCHSNFEGDIVMYDLVLLSKV